MPERSFGRTIRYRRTKIGLSQAQLGELVGRSASSIRSWERDVSIPTDPSVLTALSAILDIDGRSLFDKAGVPRPEEESQPTIEQALASLSPLPLESPIEEAVEPDPLVAAYHEGESSGELTYDLDADSELEAEVQEHEEEFPRTPEPVIEPFNLPEEPAPQAEPVGVSAIRGNEPGFVSPPEPYVITAPTPVVESSYIQDAEQRQVYRIRNLATVVLIVALAIILLWSFSNAIEALGDWWDDFVGILRI